MTIAGILYATSMVMAYLLLAMLPSAERGCLPQSVWLWPAHRGLVRPDAPWRGPVR
jgi:hypothetical protein